MRGVGAYFGTDFDEPTTVLELPADVTGGQQPGVCIVDQVVRGTGIVGRVTGDFGAVALKIAGVGQPVQVEVTVQLDEVATRWWSDRVRPARGAPERPRVVLVRSQGQVRGAVLLARRQGWVRAGGVRATVGFALTAAELDSDGLLVVELAEPRLPSWAASALSARSALGLRIDRITVRPGPRTPADDGTADNAAADPTRESGCPFVLLPATGATEFRLTADAVPPAPPVPRSPGNRWTRQKPARAAFKVLRVARRAAGRAAHEATGGGLRPASAARAGTVRAADLITGADVPVQVVAQDSTGWRLRLAGPLPAGPPTAGPPTAGPVLLGLVDAAPTTSCRVVADGPVVADGRVVSGSAPA